MTKKVTLTLPDDLYEEAQKLKGKKKGKLNFSGIFQKALAKAIKNEEDFERRLKEDQTMEQIVERLRKEKIALEGDYYDKGQEDGLEWAKAASYKTIQVALNWSPDEGMPRDEDLAEYLDDAMSDDLSKEVFQIREIREGGRTYYSVNDSAIEFMRGWKVGVERFWEEIKDKL